MSMLYVCVSRKDALTTLYICLGYPETNAKRGPTHAVPCAIIFSRSRHHEVLILHLGS